MFNRRLSAAILAGIVLAFLSTSGFCANKTSTKQTKPVQQKTVNRSGRVSKPNALVSRGMSFVGTRYKWGGASYDGVDCSGLMVILFKKEGINLPHSAKEQYKLGKSVNKKDLKAGDLVFFNTRGSVSHVGMYIGSGKFIHAVDKKRGVRVDELNSSYYKKRFVGARRILKS